MVVPHNLEMLVVWGAGHNVQRVSRHGFEMYLAKYVSKAEPITKIELPESASAPERYLKTRVIGAIEALEVLMSFQQHRMSCVAIYLPTELKPSTKVLKGKKQLESLSPDSEDIFYKNKFETYLQQAYKQQARGVVVSDDSDDEQDDKGDFSEYRSYAAIREREVSLLKTRVQAHLQTVSSNGQFTAVFSMLEKAKCPQDVVAIFADAFHQTAFERTDTVPEADFQVAEHFLQNAAFESCAKVVEKHTGFMRT